MKQSLIEKISDQGKISSKMTPFYNIDSFFYTDLKTKNCEISKINNFLSQFHHIIVCCGSLIGWIFNGIGKQGTFYKLMGNECSRVSVTV